MSACGRKARADNIARSDDVAKALAGLTTTTEECAENIDHIPGAPCSSRKMLEAITSFVIEKTAAADAESDAEIVHAAEDALKCTSESCVIMHPTFQQYVITKHLMPEKTLQLELAQRFKAPGPRDSMALLSNYNIDGTLQRWARVFPEFYPCAFAMMDFDRNGDYFGSTSMSSIFEGRVDTNLGPGFRQVRRKASCFGCVVNTDTSSGVGKHWVAVFVDGRQTKFNVPWTIEYFNSAGNPPPRPMVIWMARTRANLESYRQGPVATIPVTDMDHQESQTECGLYALFYIRRRLEEVPYTFFYEQRIPDAAMTTFRQHVFRAA